MPSHSSLNHGANLPTAASVLLDPVCVTVVSVRTIQRVESTEGEESTWAAALGNDGDSFVAIFDLHQNRVYRHALRLTANVHDAEDVTAAAFLELWRRRRSVRVVDGSVLPWLLVTTANLARNHVRGLRRYKSLLATLPRGDESRSAEDAAVERSEGDRAAVQIQQALRSLTPSDAALLTLTVIERYSPAQAAAALGISDGAARTRLHRARARLATSLESLDSADVDVTTREANQ